MLLILAPSKTQQFINRNFPHFSHPVFQEKTSHLANILKSLTKTEISKLMKTSEKLTSSTLQRIHNFQPPFSIEKAHQAIFTFQGDAYSQMTPENYSENELFYAQKHLYILSGLYGILRPLDLMFPYRLEMGAKLTTKTAKNLYHFWSDSLTDFISSSLTEMGSRIVVNLASAEYSKVINQKKLQGEIVTIIFRQKKNGLSKAIPVYSKKARGLMTHFAITGRMQEAEELKSFNLDGYSYRRKESAKEIWVFDKN